VPAVTDADPAEEDGEAAAEWAAAHPHPTGQRRKASLGVAATLKWQADDEGADTEPPAKKPHSSAAGHSAGGAAAAAAAAAGGHAGAHTRKGHGQLHSLAHPQHHTEGDHTRPWMPEWVAQRVQQGREPVYTDIIGPVRTAHDAELFTVVVREQQEQRGPGPIDWVSGMPEGRKAVFPCLQNLGMRGMSLS
jgi:hypothetical protein